jgi:hypothetical protein
MAGNDEVFECGCKVTKDEDGQSFSFCSEHQRECTASALLSEVGELFPP